MLSLTKENQILFDTLKFFIKFNLFAIPLYIMLAVNFEIVELELFTAEVVHNILLGAGFDAIREGTMISIPVQNGTWAAVINWDCVGWKSMFALFALIFATSFPLRKKLWGLLLIPAVYLINLIRIWFMFFFVKTYDLAYYELVHTVIWSWGLIIVVLSLWILWMKFPSENLYTGKKKIGVGVFHEQPGRKAEITRRKGYREYNRAGKKNRRASAK